MKNPARDRDDRENNTSSIPEELQRKGIIEYDLHNSHQGAKCGGARWMQVSWPDSLIPSLVDLVHNVRIHFPVHHSIPESLGGLDFSEFRRTSSTCLQGKHGQDTAWNQWLKHGIKCHWSQ